MTLLAMRSDKLEMITLVVAVLVLLMGTVAIVSTKFSFIFAENFLLLLIPAIGVWCLNIVISWRKNERSSMSDILFIGIVHMAIVRLFISYMSG